MARILIADDEQPILEVMTDVLQSAGHEIVGVSDGREALFQLQSSQFDLAIFDVNMPKMHGYHLAQAVHSLKDPPIVLIITARNFDGDQQLLAGTGAAAFIQKPFSNKELVETTFRLLQSKGK